MSGPPVHLIDSVPDYRPSSRIKLRRDCRPTVPYTTGYVVVEIGRTSYIIQVMRGDNGTFHVDYTGFDIVIKEASLSEKEIHHVMSLCVN